MSRQAPPLGGRRIPLPSLSRPPSERRQVAAKLPERRDSAPARQGRTERPSPTGLSLARYQPGGSTPPSSANSQRARNASVFARIAASNHRALSRANS